jgi:PTS system mannose-specific IIA component
MVGVVITTHGNLASAFLEVAEAILGKQEALAAVGVMAQDGKKEISEHLVQAVSRVRQQDGVLILTGIFGESDYKMSLPLFANQHVRVVTGLNLPMLFKVLTYRSKLNLEDLVGCACTSGKAGIIACESMKG